MNGRTGSSILRSIPRNRTPSSSSSSCGSSPQHTSSSSLFRLSPSITAPTITPSSNSSSQIILSRRALSSSLRQQSNASTLRAALSCEASTLRYALLLESEGEEALLRGWDAGVAVEDDDGTWVISCECVFVCACNYCDGCWCWCVLLLRCVCIDFYFLSHFTKYIPSLWLEYHS